MGRQRIDYKVILTALSKHKDLMWGYMEIQDGARDKISLNLFRKVLMLDDKDTGPAITSSQRKVKELWQTMFDLDFFMKINASDVALVDLTAVAKVLGYKIYTREEMEIINKECEEVCQPAL